MRVSGGSSTIEATKILIETYIKSGEPIQLNLLPASQSDSTIAGIKEGLLDIGLVVKTLNPNELPSDLGQWVIAQDGIIVATNPTVEGVTNLTTENLKAIYSGKATNWQEFGGPDAPIVVLDRPEDESAKRLLREHYLGPNLVNSPETVVLRKQDELILALQSTPYSIGSFSLANAISEKLPVNLLSLNGVEPTLDNIKSGQYKMVRPIVVFYKKPTSESVQGFLDFLSTPEATALLRELGYSPSQTTL
jgi:phosphate transport system substrate-binding protein